MKSTGAPAARAASSSERVAATAASASQASAESRFVKPSMKSTTTTAGRSPAPWRPPNPRGVVDVARAHRDCHSASPSRALTSSKLVKRSASAAVVAVADDGGRELLVGLREDPRLGAREDDELVAHRLELRGRDRRRPSGLRHVREARARAAARRSRAYASTVRRRVDEDEVGAGVGVRVAAGDRVLEPGHLQRVGARDDQRLVRPSRRDGGAHLEHHLLGRDHLLALHVAAALRRDLILDLHGVRAGRLELAHGQPDAAPRSRSRCRRRR